MPDHDPIEELSRFGAGLSSGGGDMPHSAAQVRRRGDQIRRRRTALVAGASALAVGAIATPILAVVTGDGDGDRTLPAKDPNGSAQVLGARDLLTDDDTVYNDSADWFTVDTFPGDGQAGFHRCARESLTGLGAGTVHQREFELRNTREIDGETPPEVTGDRFNESIAQFPDVATASAAYDTIAEWIRDCTAMPDTGYRYLQSRDVAVGTADSEAQILDAQYDAAPEDAGDFGELGYITETGLIRVGDRIAVLGLQILGQDYNFTEEEGGTPVNQMIPRAAELLQPGDLGESPQPEPEPGPEPGSGPEGSSIAGGFPLAAGWPDRAGDGAGLTGPGEDLEPIALDACGTSVAEAPYTDRLIARWEDAEDYRSRQLTTYASAEEAVAAVAAIRQVFADCPVGPTREDGFTPNWQVRDTTVGGESFAVLGWDELDGAPTPFGDTLLVVRLGSSVLVTARSGHAGNPQGAEQEAIDAIVAESADVIAAMCAFTEAGC